MWKTLLIMLFDRVLKAAFDWLKDFIERKKAERELKKVFSAKLKEVKNEPDPKLRAAAVDKFLNGVE